MARDNLYLGYIIGFLMAIGLDYALDKSVENIIQYKDTHTKFVKVNNDAIPDMITHEGFGKNPFVMLSNSDSTYTLLQLNEVNDSILKTLKDSTPAKKDVFSDIGTIVTQ